MPYTARLQSRAQPHPILYFLTNSAHLSAKKFFPENIFFDDLPPPPRRQKNFGQGTILGV